MIDTLMLDGAPIAGADLAAMARRDGPVTVVLSDAVRARVARARAAVDGAVASGVPIYGVTTGLGANVDLRIDADAVRAFQTQAVAGRVMGAGERLPPAVSRAALLALIATLSRGAAGVAPAVLDHLIAMAGADLWPVLPRWGSIGDSDLTQTAHIGWAALGRGPVWRAGRVIAGETAMVETGLTPPDLGPKDGLVLINNSAVTIARAALALDDARHRFNVGLGVAALSAEGFAMNPAIFAEDVNALRPAAGQAEVAAWFRHALAGSPMAEPGAARRVQDALSFRLMACVFGQVRHALGQADAALAAELNGAPDSPAVFAAEADGRLASTPNFHTGALALSLEGLRLALAHMAAASAQRVLKMMKPEISALPKYLSPEGGVAAGYMPLQKTAAALLADIRRHAHPVTMDSFAISDMVEDVCAHTPLSAQALADLGAPLRLLTAIEALVAAQAVDLRRPDGLGPVAGPLHAAIRARVPMMTGDRPGGPDVDAVADVLDGLEIPLDPT